MWWFSSANRAWRHQHNPCSAACSVRGARWGWGERKYHWMESTLLPILHHSLSRIGARRALTEQEPQHGQSWRLSIFNRSRTTRGGACAHCIGRHAAKPSRSFEWLHWINTPAHTDRTSFMKVCQCVRHWRHPPSLQDSCPARRDMFKAVAGFDCSG